MTTTSTGCIDESRDHYQVTLWIVVPASVLGMLIMIGLMRSFYAWVFNPIRDLEIGVGRVAKGDFTHRIEVRSGDEMEELAAAFNDMMERLRGLYDNLAQQVNDRSRQLVRSEKLASVGFLAAGVAHEINNPLASIAFCSEALESRLGGLVQRASESRSGRRRCGGLYSLFADDSGRGFPLQEHHGTAVGVQPHRRTPARADGPRQAWCNPCWK